MATGIAIDIGAASGRIISGSLNNGIIKLAELYRFPNGIQFIDGHHRWQIDRIFQQICQGLKKSTESGIRPSSVGIDTWGVDFVLVDADGNRVELPVSYRDGRTDGIMRRFFSLMPKEEVYNRTGIQLMQFNSLFQLYASLLEDATILEKAETFLMIPDYLNYRLTGIKATEYTIASTTQLLNIAASQWDEALIDLLNIKSSMFLHPRNPGSVLGDIDATIQKQTGITGATVVLPGTHDTASAVAAIPVLKPDNWAYISSGTWSLIGIEINEPILSPKALDYNFTNEGGVNSTIRFLKNIMGLWPVQEMQRQFDGKYTIEDMISQARQATPFESLIDPEDPVFLAPGDMVERISEYCKKTDQPAPNGVGQLARCVFDSLSFQYRQVLKELNDINGAKIDRIHIVGGGSRNQLLNQLCADVTGCEVFAGPTEVASLGNLLLQFVANGDISSLQDGRQIIRKSFEIKRYEPKTVPGLDAIYERFLSLRQIER